MSRMPRHVPAFTQIVSPSLLALSAAHVQTFCEYISKTPPAHATATPCAQVCAEIVALNALLQQPTLDAFVLLPQLLRITNMAVATDLHGHVHDFARHTHAKFPCNDTHGTPTTENIMRVIHDMAEVLAALCQPGVLFTETAHSPVRLLLGELKAIISSEALVMHNMKTVFINKHKAT